MVDVTDATFEAEVVQRSHEVPVVVDLWAEWCGPCRTLGPILEKVIDATDGKVVLAKVDTDANPQVSAAFQVQSIPAVFAMKDGKVADGFIGAQPEWAVTEFVNRLIPTEEQTELQQLIEAGDEASLRKALELDPDNADAVVGLAELLVVDGKADEALELIERIPPSADTRRVAALARTGVDAVGGDIDAKLDALLLNVKTDDDARQEFVDLLELLGPDDPRTAAYRRKLTTALY
ncbi:MAG: thioredoxin [Microthrixaceae bacterium]|nr:thioredoxin [Microthrixaceae bacterium]